MFKSTAQWISTGWNSQQIFFYQNVQLDMCQKVKMEAQTTKQWASPDSHLLQFKDVDEIKKKIRESLVVLC